MSDPSTSPRTPPSAAESRPTPPSAAAAPATPPAAAATGRGRRPACASVPAFALQVLLRRRPEWEGGPVAVVAKDEPLGLVLQANEEARSRGVLPGQKFAAALALAGDLRAGTVPDDEVRAAVDEAADALRRFTPDVEPSRDEPGVFWLEAGGLGLLHPDLRAWAVEVRAALGAAGLRACVAVGFTRFGTYAVARALAARLLPADGAAPAQQGARKPARQGEQQPAQQCAHQPAQQGAQQPTQPGAWQGARHPVSPATTVVVFPDAAAESRALRRVPLDRLGIDPDARDLLAKLGVRTVDGFLALPERGLGERFGDAARRLHRLATGEVRDPLRPEPPPDPLRLTVFLEHPESDGTRLLFILKRLLDPLLARAADRREAVAAAELRLRLDDGGERADLLRPAAPTLDAPQILELLRLRLESARLPCGATEVTLVAHGTPAEPAQLALFAERPKRDLATADRALARLRAEFGDDAVVRARLRDAHLPEASFAWEPLEHAQLPRARASSRPALVRRLVARPVPLPPRPRQEPDGWLLRGFEHGNVVRLDGPYVVSGGWWAGEGVRREYHFAETSRGGVFWVFHDVRRRRWFLQGDVS